MKRSVREAKKQEKRTLILTTTARLFKEKGYHATTIADIIRETGLARGTFYLYFREKQEIFNEMLKALYTSLTAGVWQFEIEKFQDRESFYNQLVALGYRLLKIFREHREVVQILVSNPAGADSAFDRQVHGFYTLLVEVARGMIERGIETGRIVPHDSKLLSLILTGGLREFVFQWLTTGLYEDELEDKIEQIVFFFMRGVEVR